MKVKMKSAVSLVDINGKKNIPFICFHLTASWDFGNSQMKHNMIYSVCLQGMVLSALPWGPEPHVLSVWVCRQEQLLPADQPGLLHQPWPPHILPLHWTLHRHGENFYMWFYHNDRTARNRQCFALQKVHFQLVWLWNTQGFTDFILSYTQNIFCGSTWGSIYTSTVFFRL